MYKKILSVFSAVLMLLSAATNVTADTGAEPTIVNLVIGSNGKVRNGVSVSCGNEGVNPDYSGEMTDQGALKNVIDGKDSSFWYSMHKYNNPYVVLDLGSVYTLTSIRYLPFDGYTDDYTDENGILQKPGRYWRNQTEIHLSNDADFSSYKLVWSTDYEGLADNAAAEVTLEDNINQYRYIRIYRVTPNDYTYPIGIREISVTGYEAFYPQDMLHNSDGTVRNGVIASSPNGGYTGYTNINSVFDNKYGTWGGTTYISNFGEVNPYVQIDLGSVRGIEKVRILPFKGNSWKDADDWYFRSGLKIYGSNNPGFEGGGVLLYNQGEYSENNYVSRNKWLETDLSEIMLLRYIRVVAQGDVIGLTEVQVEGYEIFEDIAIASETSPEIYFVTDGVNITAKAINGGDNMVILAAYEENGRMASIKTSVGSASLPISAGCTYKAFLWNSLTELKPEAEPVIYK